MLRRKINVAFAVAVFVLVLTGGVSLWNNHESSLAVRARRVSFVRRLAISELLSLAQDAETGQRGFLLTRRNEFLEPYQKGVDWLPVRLAALRDLLAGDAAQEQRLARVEPSLQTKLGELARTLALARGGRMAEAVALVSSGEGKRSMDEIRALIAEMMGAEDALLNRWNARLIAAERVSVWTNAAAGLLAVGFLLVAALAINRDITKRTAAEDALHESESRLFQILEAMPVGVFAIDAHGKAYYANRASQAILGKGVAGDSELGALPEVYQAYRAGTDELLRADDQPIAHALAGETAYADDIEIRRPDRSVPVEVHAAPVHDTQGRLTYAIAAFSDITARREAEKALRRAMAAAEAANRAKSDFLAKMSHELRTPLNSIIGFSELMEDGTAGALTDRQRRYVSNILTSGRGLLQLINDILDLSKVEAGRMELSIAPFDAGAVAHEIAAIVRGLSEQKKHVLACEVEPGLPPLFADQQRFKQILFNLFSNAIKYTPDGGDIRVTLAQREEDGHRVIEVAVADTGIGIRPEDHERVFREFEQINTAYAREQEGTGLGLALTKKLVDLHGGRIWLESEAGKGSVFRFVLPSSPERRRAPRATPAAAMPAVPEGDGLLVLVVDDDPQAGDLLQHHLTRAGYRVARAANGDEAIAFARQHRPDLITLDILLQGRGGLNVLAELKAEPATQGIPVVVVSITDQRELGFSLGAADWFVKPVRSDQLLAAARRATRSAPAARAPVVLVIDDEPATVELLEEVLGGQGFRVLAAGDGRRGIEVALAERPDLIVLDLIMPEVTGFDVVAALRAHPDCREIPILVFTVKDLSVAEREQLRGSVKAIVAKGGPADLVAELRRAMAPEGERA